jgi:hypothetical protein
MPLAARPAHPRQLGGITKQTHQNNAGRDEGKELTGCINFGTLIMS